jgi:hypothetical protein
MIIQRVHYSEKVAAQLAPMIVGAGDRISSRGRGRRGRIESPRGRVSEGASGAWSRGGLSSASGFPDVEEGKPAVLLQFLPHLFLFPSWTDCSILERNTYLNRTDYQPWNRSALDGWCDGRIREFFCQPLEAKQKYNNLIDGKHFQVQGYGND